MFHVFEILVTVPIYKIREKYLIFINYCILFYFLFFCFRFLKTENVLYYRAFILINRKLSGFCESYIKQLKY